MTCFQDLENYILELIPTLPQLDGLEKSFYSFYVCTAVRKFFTGRVKIQDILACSFLDDLLEVNANHIMLCIYVPHVLMFVAWQRIKACPFLFLVDFISHTSGHGTTTLRVSAVFMFAARQQIITDFYCW